MDRRPKIITPNAYRNWRKSIKESYGFARFQFREARAALARDAGRGGFYADVAAGHIVTAQNCREDARRAQQYLRSVTVEKYSNLSPTAARRESARRCANPA